MCKLSYTYAIYCQRSWHRHWHAAWYWRGWTTAVHCFTAHIPTVSRHNSACRTTPLGLFCKRRVVPHKPAAAPAPLAAGSSQNQLQAGCDDVQDPQHRFTCIPESSHQPLRNNTNITFIWHFTAHRTIHQDGARKACLPMRSFICLELTTFIRHQQRLWPPSNLGSWKLTFFVCLLTVAYTSNLNPLLPAPLKLRPYGTL